MLGHALFRRPLASGAYQVQATARPAAGQVRFLSYRDRRRPFRLIPAYQVKSSLKVVRIIMSYTEYVDRTVWHR